jgi:hypothetical protein
MGYKPPAGISWQTIPDAPLDEVLAKPAKDVEELLQVRAWEVKESPVDLGYRLVEDWPKLPRGMKLGFVSGASGDSKGNYYVYQRGPGTPALLCFDREGNLLRSWGDSQFGRPHSVRCDKDDNVWLVNDGAHVCNLYSPAGQVIQTLGIAGVKGLDARHFNRCTDIAFGIEGRYYVSDGYGAQRCVYFDKECNYLGAWGSVGEREGQFVLPHGIETDPMGLVYVADRSKWRVQIFNPEGGFWGQWTHIGKAFGLIYNQEYLWVNDGTNQRVTKVDLTGKVIGWVEGGGHGMGMTPNGDIIIARSDGQAQLFSRD